VATEAVNKGRHVDTQRKVKHALTVPAAPRASDRLNYYRHLLSLWSAGRPAASIQYRDYLRELIARSSILETRPVAIDDDLRLFRRLVMDRPDDLRRRLLGANLLRFRALGREQRAALRILEVSPDLLSPLGELRYEPAHSRLLGYFLDRGRIGDLAGPLLKAMLALIEAPIEALDDDNIARAAVSTEVIVSEGRVDLQIASPALLAFIEVKIDAGEGPSQLQRYYTALGAHEGACAKVLGYLTLPGAAGPEMAAPCIHFTFAELLSRWLPHARTHDDASAYLARYLSSVARLLGYTNHGSFEDWTFAAQRRALNFVSQVDVGGTS
jgi:hypothetical protein